MLVEQRKSAEPMSPSERGEAVFQIKTDIFDALGKNPAFQKAQHARFVGCLSPTKEPSGIHDLTFMPADNLRACVRHYLDGLDWKTRLVRGRMNITMDDLGKDGEVTRRISVWLDSDYRHTEEFPVQVTDHIDGTWRVFKNHDLVDYSDDNPDSIKTLRKYLSPILGKEPKKKAEQQAEQREDREEVAGLAIPFGFMGED